MKKLTINNYSDLTAKARKYKLIGGKALILLGDSAEILKDTKSKFDAGIMDPPYDFEAQGGKNRFGNKTNAFEVMREKGLADGFDYNIIREIAKTAPSMLMFYHNDQDYDLTGLLTQSYMEGDIEKGEEGAEYGFYGQKPPLYNRFCKCLWKKTNPLPVANKNYVPDFEPWIHAWNLPAFDVQGTLEEKRRIIEAPVGKSEYEHPTVKPLKIMRKCVTNASKPGDVVIDPFAGSGSTGVAALDLGRLFIGIERDEEYYDLTIHRIKGILGAHEPGDAHNGQTILI